MKTGSGPFTASPPPLKKELSMSSEACFMESTACSVVGKLQELTRQANLSSLEPKKGNSSYRLESPLFLGLPRIDHGLRHLLMEVEPLLRLRREFYHFLLRRDELRYCQGCGSGFRRAKMTHKSRKKFVKDRVLKCCMAPFESWRLLL